MKIYIIFFLIFISHSFLIFSKNNNNPANNLTNNDELIKRKIMLMPFINNSLKTEYNYLANVIRNALRIELENKDIYNFADFTEIDDKIKFIKYKDIETINKYQLMNIAMKMSSDVIVIGSFDIHEEKITINIYAIDILTGERVIDIKKEDELGVNLLNLVDNVAKIMSEEMFKELTMVRKSYYEEKIKKQSKKITLKIKKDKRLESFWNKFENKEDKNKILDIEGKILILNYKSINFDKEIAQKILEITVKSILDIKKCEIINFDLIKDKIKNFNEIKEENIIRLAKAINVNFIILGNIKYVVKTNQKNKIIIDTKVIDIKKEKTILVRKKESKIIPYNSVDELIKLFNKNKIIIDKILLLNKGLELTIGGGFNLFKYQGKYSTKIIYNFKHRDEDYIDINTHYDLQQFKWDIFIPLSLSYFINPNFSLGFIAKFNYAPGFYFVIISEYNEPVFINNISFNISLKNKFIKNNSSLRFLLEIGFLTLFEIFSKQFILEHSDGTFNHGDFFISIGPEMLIGFEYIKNKFSIESGLVLNGTFGWQSLENYSIDLSRGININFSYGFEVRFNIRSFNNYLTKSIKISK